MLLLSFTFWRCFEVPLVIESYRLTSQVLDGLQGYV